MPDRTQRDVCSGHGHGGGLRLRYVAARGKGFAIQRTDLSRKRVTHICHKSIPWSKREEGGRLRSQRLPDGAPAGMAYAHLLSHSVCAARDQRRCRLIRAPYADEVTKAGGTHK